MPTAHGQCGSALQQFHYPLLPGSVAVRYSSCSAYYPQAAWQRLAQVNCPLPLGIVSLYCRRSIA